MRGLCRCLCAEGEREQSSLANHRAGDGDEVVEGEKETKNMGGSEVERDLVPVWQMCFFYTSSVGSLFHRNTFDLQQYVTDYRNCKCWCADRQSVYVCPNHYISYLQCASAAAGISHALS